MESYIIFCLSEKHKRNCIAICLQESVASRSSGEMLLGGILNEAAASYRRKGVSLGETFSLVTIMFAASLDYDELY